MFVVVKSLHQEYKIGKQIMSNCFWTLVLVKKKKEWA
jgi:hypothetical protein